MSNVYDCFLYFGEKELLEIRMEELWDIVDKFVITESNVTFCKGKKKMYFKNSSRYFKKYKEKIIYLEADLSSIVGTPWDVEYAQRDYFVDNLGFNSDDIVIVGDIDEIPKKEALEQAIKNISINNFCPLSQKFYYYYVNISVIDTKGWRGSFVTLGDVVKNRKPSWWRLKKVRSTRIFAMPDAGWHFSYLGGASMIRTKMMASFNLPKEFYSLNRIKKCINNLEDIHSRDRLKFYVNDTDLPRYLIENKEKFKHLFYEKEHYGD
jgi:beta-1,4-mannosyl-glycoprotein beta-1,4-N-acetylglucosaminyltransferase